MSLIVKARRTVAHGEMWDLDEVVVHEQFAGMTACRRAVGTRSKGWLSQEAWQFDRVTCRQCIAALKKGRAF